MGYGIVNAKRYKNRIFLLFETWLMITVLVFSITANIPPAEAQLPLPEGVPRGDVLVVRKFGQVPDPYNFNLMVPGRIGGRCFNQLAAVLWYANTTNGQIIPWLAEKAEYSDDYTTCRIYTRKGAYWNDGVPFTAHDVVFTIQTALSTAEWTTHGYAEAWVKEVSAENDTTVLVKLNSPNPRFHYDFASIIWSSSWWICPKHMWQGQDPVAYKFYPPLSIGPYSFKALDPAGLWVLFERAEDWWAYRLWGLKPCPKYMLWINHGAEDKSALAMSKHELDFATFTGPEVAEVAVKGGAPYVTGYSDQSYAWPYDPAPRDVSFNLMRYPFNITEVRKALTFALDMSELALAFQGFDGSTPTSMPIPIPRKPELQTLYYEPLKDNLTALGINADTWFWKHDPQEAENILLGIGFSKDAGGKWLLPSGEPWKFKVIGIQSWVDSSRLSFLFAEQWKEFGIDVEAELAETSTVYTKTANGDYDVTPQSYYGTSTLLWDLTPAIKSWHSKYFLPESPGSGWRGYQFPRRAELDSIIDEMEATPPTEKDKLVELGRKALMIAAEQYAFPTIFSIPQYTLMDTYAWYGWPSPSNYYLDPVFWWWQGLFITLKLYPSGRVPTKDALLKPGGEVPTNPTPEFPTEELSTLNDQIGNMTDLISSLTDQVVALTKQTSMLMYGIAFEAIIIAVLAVLIVFRKKPTPSALLPK